MNADRAGFSNMAVIYYKSLWLPVKGHVVPRGMIGTATKQ